LPSSQLIEPQSPDPIDQRILLLWTAQRPPVPLQPLCWSLQQSTRAAPHGRHLCPGRSRLRCVRNRLLSKRIPSMRRPGRLFPRLGVGRTARKDGIPSIYGKSVSVLVPRTAYSIRTTCRSASVRISALRRHCALDGPVRLRGNVASGPEYSLVIAVIFSFLQSERPADFCPRPRFTLTISCNLACGRVYQHLVANLAA